MDIARLVAHMRLALGAALLLQAGLCAADASVWMDWRPKLAVADGGGLIVGTIEAERVLDADGTELSIGTGAVWLRRDDSASSISMVARSTDTLLAKAEPNLVMPESRLWVFWAEVKPGGFHVDRILRFDGAGELSLQPKKPHSFEVQPGQVTYVGRFFITGHNQVCVRRIAGNHEPVEYFARCLRGIYAENTDKFAEDKPLALRVLPEPLRALPWPETVLEPALAPRDRTSFQYLLERAAAARPQVRRQRPSEAEIEALRGTAPPRPDPSRN